ncbi:MAG: hypothetical protein AUH28_03030 [Acidobacteria bacterium 13_1_40CM_56_16]|nr:MAG: hypothetical protein AUH28_03030 [Acidobacteria bacterium 13_1_40CM_56_16]
MAVCLCFCAAIGAAQSTSQVIQGEEIENFLAQAKITRQQSISVGVTLPRKLSLELDGKVQFGAFKTIDEGPVPTKQLDGGVELQFQDSWRTEVAAYELDKLIGLGMVPATIERTVDGKRGSLQFWVTAQMDEGQRVKKKLSAPNPIMWNQQVAILITDSWQIRLIDHSRTFRPFEQLKDPKAPTTFSRSLLAKLEELNEAMLKEHLGKYLTPYQIQGLLKRRDAILARSKELIAEKGAGAVLYQ